MNVLIPRLPPQRKEPTLGLEEWYALYESMIELCIQRMIQHLETACYRESTSEKELIVDKAGLHDALVHYLYETSYNKLHVWVNLYR